MVEEWSWNPAVQVRHRWTVTPLAKAKERDASCADVLATQRKTTANSINARARARAKEKEGARLTRTAPPSSRASVATVARKATNVADCGKRLAEARDEKVHAVDGTPSTATAAVEDTGEIDEAGICGRWSDDDDSGVDTSETWVLSVEGSELPADAEFFPLDSACEENTCSTCFGSFECAVEKREWSFDSFRQEGDGVI